MKCNQCDSELNVKNNLIIAKKFPSGWYTKFNFYGGIEPSDDELVFCNKLCFQKYKVDKE